MEYAAIETEKAFLLHEGPSIPSLDELFAELQTMQPHQFYHHVTHDKHDFAQWVGDVFQDRFLSKQMLTAKTREVLQNTIFVSLFR